MGAFSRGFRSAGTAVVVSLGLAAAAPAALAAGTSPGQIYAFGSNVEGELGNPNISPANPTPTLVNLPGATGGGKLLAVGTYFSLAVTSTDQLFSWGWNYTGQLGSAANPNPNPKPAQVSLPEASGPTAVVAAGQNYTLALTTTGQLYTFGDNDFGEDGLTNLAPNPPTLVTLQGAKGAITQVAAGAESSLALTATGQVFGWGSNVDGALGFHTGGTTETPPGVATAPQQLTFANELGPVTDIAEGSDFGLAITASGQIYAWGDNSRGQLGVPNKIVSNDTPFPIVLPPGAGLPIDVTAGDSYSLVLTSTGKVYAFGDNDFGELGFTPDGSAHATPVQVNLPGEIGPVVSVAAGINRGLAVTASGQLFAWGQNTYGELGFNTGGNPQPTPTLVPFPAGTTVDAVSSGPLTYHTLVLIADLAITTSALPAGQVASGYGATPTATGGTPAYAWQASGLPSGLAINPATGTVSGTPSTAGTFNPVLTVTDADGIAVSRSVALTVAPPPPPTAHVTLASSVGPVATFTIACHGIAGQACAETIAATTRLRESGSTILGVTALAKPPHHGHRPVTVTATVAHASYSVPAGTSATVPLSLNGVGMRVLSHFLRLPTNVTFTGTSAVALHVTFGYPRVPISVSNQWAWGCTASGECHTTVQKLSVAGLPARATVTVLCDGGGCQFRKHVLRPHGAKLAVTSLFAGTNLRPASKVTIEVSAAQRVGYEVVYTVQRNSVPSAKTLCLEPGARNPLACT